MSKYENNFEVLAPRPKVWDKAVSGVSLLANGEMDVMPAGPITPDSRINFLFRIPELGHEIEGLANITDYEAEARLSLGSIGDLEVRTNNHIPALPLDAIGLRFWLKDSKTRLADLSATSVRAELELKTGLLGRCMLVPVHGQVSDFFAGELEAFKQRAESGLLVPQAA
jgi:hypothetical protein